MRYSFPHSIDGVTNNTRVSGDTDYEYELTASREEIAAVLSGVVDGILTGAIRLGDGADAVSVGVSDTISLEIELESESDESSLELELEWPVPEEDSAAPSIETRPGETDEEPALVDTAGTSQSVARFEIFRDRAEEWRWRLRHRNGNIIAVSGEGYTRKHNAKKGLRSVMANSAEAEMREESPN